MSEPIARASDLKGDGPHGLSAAGTDLVVVRTKAGLRAYEGHCPHQGAMLSEGELDGDVLVCRNHRWRFAAESGRRVGGPEHLVACPIRESGGAIYAESSTVAASQAAPRAPTRRIADLPGPKGLPLLGNLHQIDLSALHLQLERWAGEYGPMYRYRLGPQLMIAVASPELNQQVLRQRPETYRRMSKVEPVFKEMGVAGVFSAEGAAWRPQRRLSMEALSHRHLRGFYATLKTVAERLKRRWDAAADRHDVVDITDDLKRFTVDITTLLTFGHDVNTIDQHEGELQKRLELLFPAFHQRLFAVVPTWRYFRLPRDRRVDRAIAWLQGWLQELVAAARTRMAAEPARALHPSNFLEAMLAARDEAGRPFSDETLFGNLMTMLLGGEDTTAYTLAWAVHELCDSPASVESLRAEAAASSKADVVPADMETASGLAYAAAVAKEAMRLRPIAPLLFHDTNVETVLGDVRLPPRTTVVLLTRLAALAAEHFDDPTAFHPGRWVGPPAGAHDPSVHIPFGSGPRLCPGRTLALLEMNVVLSTLYGNFDVERVGRSADVREVMAFTMYPDGLRVRLRRR